MRSRLPEVSCAALRSFPRALSVGALLVNERTAAPHEHVSALVLFTCHTKKSKLTRLPDACGNTDTQDTALRVSEPGAGGLFLQS